jgi:hypothetical protein
MFLDHFAINATAAPTYLRTFLGDDLLFNYTDGKPSEVISRFETVSKVVGSITPIPNTLVYFVTEVLQPPVNLNLTATHYNLTNYLTFLNASKNLTLAPRTADNT